MTTDVIPPSAAPQTATRSRPAQRGVDPSVREIIAQARAREPKAPARGAWLLSATSGLLFYASFTPLEWGPLAWIALVPLLLLVRLTRPTRWMYAAVYVCGFATMIAQLQWLRLGDQTMYLAWLALSLYLALYFPLFVWLSRVAVHRLGVPLVIAAPAIWTATELSRAYLMTGFAWYFLGHTQYQWIELIQISDVTGAYGVTFVIVMANAAMAVLVPPRVFERLRLVPESLSNQRSVVAHPPQPPLVKGGSSERPALIKVGSRAGQLAAVSSSLAVFVAVLAYGYVRRGQGEFREGPRVALVQGNFTSDVKFDPEKQQRIFYKHLALTATAAKHQPDVIVWPETSYPNRLWIASPDVSDDQLRRWTPQIPPEHWRSGEAIGQLAEMSRIHNAALLVGVSAAVAEPKGLHPYNSAAFVRPTTGFAGRYDKIHRVVFGEYMPLRGLFPWLYRLTPYPEDFGIEAGRQAVVFSDRGWRYIPLICFEDTVPHLVRSVVRGTKDKDGEAADVLVNVTNDGWFHGSSELNQHLITAVFRSVECRMPTVRAVNTGISAVIDGDGVIVEPDVFVDADGAGRTAMRDPRSGRLHKSLNAVLVDDVPLDARGSLYVEWGDWFAMTCGLLSGIVLVAGVVPRRRTSEVESAEDITGA